MGEYKERLVGEKEEDGGIGLEERWIESWRASGDSGRVQSDSGWRMEGKKRGNNEQETRASRDCEAGIIVSPSGALIWEVIPDQH